MAATGVPDYIKQYSAKYGVDPLAALSVARTEGGLGWGAVGDNGTSGGPYQLHIGGALPKGRDLAWANTPAGLEYAIRKMSESARGLTGRAAIEAIVRQFERPADPGSEINKAWGYYGGAPKNYLGHPRDVYSTPQPTGPDFGALVKSGKWGVGSSLAQTASLTRSFNRAYGNQPVPGHPEGKVFPKLQGKVPPSAASWVQEAYKWLGTPYSWAGGNASGPTKGVGRGANTVGFDCSSWAQFLAAKRGVQIPRTTYEQWRVGTAVPMNQLQPGDSLFFHMGEKGPEHTGVYLGNGKFIQAPHTGDVVKISDLSGYYAKAYVGARRYG